MQSLQPMNAPSRFVKSAVRLKAKTRLNVPLKTMINDDGMSMLLMKNPLNNRLVKPKKSSVKSTLSNFSRMLKH